MMIRDRETGTLFYEDAWREWIKANGGPTFNTLTPELLDAAGADPVLDGPMPVLERYQTAEMQGAVQVDGQWFTNWVAVDMDEEVRLEADQKQADGVRAERDMRLRRCDWTQVPDAAVDQPAWATYRQELRDVPEQDGFPWDVVWPVAPPV